MRKDRPYTAHTLSGAQAEVRRCRKLIAHLTGLFEQAHADRIAFAKLAADGPAFFNPLDIFEAKKRRDEILREWCRLNPDGTPLKAGGKR